MRTIQYSKIVDTVKTLCTNAACLLPQSVLNKLKEARDNEPFPRAQEILDQIIENANIAASTRIPICQDTGVAVFFISLGADVRIEGGSLRSAVNEGTRRGYAEGHLRGSMVDDPVFDRVNTGGNTPAVLHVELVEGDKLSLALLPKGGGCENMSALAMLKPSEGSQGLAAFVRDAVAGAGGNPCPPVVVGVGVGGTADAACVLAKKALLRPIGEHNKDSRYARLEEYILKDINVSGVGPQGLGGRHTALWVAVEYMPCHIASMPVAISINCHAARSAFAEV